MLVALQIRGKWNGKKYVFDVPSISKLYKGPIAHALGSSGGGSTTEFTPTGPWSPQVPYIQGLFGEAARQYNNGPPQYYPGNTVAQAPQGLTNSQNQIYSQTGQSNQAMNAGMQQAGQNLQQGTMAGQVGQGQIMPYNTAINGLLQSSLSNPTQSVAQSALPAFYSGLGQASQSAAGVSTPQTQFGNTDASNALNQSLNSNGMNPFTGQIIDAALRSQNQQFGQNVLPQISTQANMAGQLGGTRHGVAEGMAAGQHQIMQRDLISQLMGQAFDVGSQERMGALGLVGQGQQVNAGNSLAAQQLMEQQRQASMQSGLGQSQLVGGLLGQGQQLGQQGLSSAGQLSGNMVQQGSAQNLQNQVQNLALMPGLNNAINQNLGMANQAGLQQYGQGQAQTDADVERWFYEQYAPMNMLTQYQNWVTGPYGASADPYGGVSTAGNYTPMYGGPTVGTGAQPYSGMPPTYGQTPISGMNPTQQYIQQLMQGTAGQNMNIFGRVGTAAGYGQYPY